ncbi:DEAD/DEAH box helicase [Aeromicrobium senzhongii]|uniref:DEAD/DEAH box helicase n=1 Tax=Aeromicrobium senzhongii TaxID=2663859 RepID=A0ABX6STT1_9ACTN|nr:DEAD/DEAH box helicase [Aeromicrobium senzhongii]MTB89049.1 DEAD/DEAH box helicase [Aeromicrobium senzhongii]QNL93680.1 DEAD/DEAH box helicase [Aeromicrobium senzhongii]
MSELLPSTQAARVRDGLVDYLRTTFALADDDAGRALQEFLEDQSNGIFKGPYLRLRLPFRPAEDGWRDSLEWYEGFPPYGHQAAAFRRLTSLGLGAERPRPEPTLVTTGTGSGKTESFLYPILDHVLRAKRDGVTGMKALILYPMNALANDQAGRLATMISSHPELEGVTAALYTGQEGPRRTKVSAKGLITDRDVIRSAVPDIVLTNYKMLDQMLLREADARIWEQSATSLQYLVLDEFHTYDGAQGTDVSMLLRRLGLALKSHWGDGDPSISEADRSRPLGRITPVATSATLGDQGDPGTMLEFARTVFGEDFDGAAVVTESRLSLDEWTGRHEAAGAPVTLRELEATLDAVSDVDHGDGYAMAQAVLGVLGAPEVDAGTFEPGTEEHMLAVLRRLPLTRWLAARSAEAVALSDLAADLPGTREQAENFLLAFVAALSHVRAVLGREALSVELHLWVRELTRIDRDVSVVPHFSWSDDGEFEGDRTVLPAIYCRHCGRSGWGVVLAPVGLDLETGDEAIRGRKAAGDERFRPLIHAPAEGEAAISGSDTADNLMWLSSTKRRLTATLPDEEADVREGLVLPVLTHRGEDAGELSRGDVCPSCQRADGIRFLGSAIATMLSVTLSTLFGTSGLDQREKKALVFTDSVQDAAHRAGFVQSRSHSLTMRAVIRDAVGEGELTLDELVDRIIERSGDDPRRRYRILPPELADREEFWEFWNAPTLADVPARVRSRVRRRLLLDVQLEFGLQSRVGRTLELTGAAAARVDVPQATLLAAARWAVDEAEQQALGQPRPDDVLVAWARGVLERMRERGAIEHEWFRRYQEDDGGRYSIWGGRDRAGGMPAFPAGRAAPGYPRIGSATAAKGSDLDPVTGVQSWYARWAAKCLEVSPSEASVYGRLLMERLARNGAVQMNTYGAGVKVFQLSSPSVVVSTPVLDDLTQGRIRLVCDTCRSVVPGSPTTIDQLDGAPCMVARCLGSLQRVAVSDNFYRRMYESADIQRVVAREHTGQLDDETRLRYEEGFKESDSDPDAPNVLVATPTLEMGIDIGDLSTVMLAGLPRSVASYLQRVGRAGRLTGNALDLAFVTGRGDQLPRIGDPLSVVNGDVRPPATYLDAEEILRRQYIASVADRLARDSAAPHPTRAVEAMNAADPDGFLAVLMNRAEEHAEQYLDAFLAGFELRKEAADGLRAWATPTSGPGTSGLVRRLLEAAHRWEHEIETLTYRAAELQKVLPDLQQRAESPAASSDDKAAFRSARAASKMARSNLAHLRGIYWISVLEEQGVLPNYTLFDDSVALDVALSWVDPETGEWEEEPQTFNRGAALALREFAPGATFYARGHRIKVDAVDLGHDGEAVRTLVLCPACGHSSEADEHQPGSCPRCGSVGFADVKQRLETVELTKVSSEMKRDEAIIDDARDERVRERFTVVVAADVDPQKVSRQWFVESSGFGARHVRDMTIRWINVGKSASQGTQRTLAGSDYVAGLFRVCASCGRLDTSTQRNSASEHRPWCPNRRAVEERTRAIALTRELVTEGLVVRLPHLVALGDRYAVPSLSASLLLGLRELIGGAPDHIAVETIVDPTPGSETANHDALLLHDVVPGGTGYLADLADPDGLRNVLHRAWAVVRDCPCADEGRLACHRCLLPFAPAGRSGLVSRVAAERHLREILFGSADDDLDETSSWVLTEEPVEAFDPETKIEQRFRAVLQERLSALNAHVTEKPGPHGNRLIIRFAGRTWTLEPQVNVLGSKPDFLLRCDQPVPDVAIFCDGWTYHASPRNNRLADDALKRRDLRDAGYIVLGISWADLEGESERPPWWNSASRDMLKAYPPARLHPSSVELLEKGPLDLLVAWIAEPDVERIERLANWMPMFSFGTAVEGTSALTDDLSDLAVDLLDGRGTRGTGARTWHWTSGTVSFVARHASDAMDDIELAVVLDDREEMLGIDRKDAWREWLRFANLVNLRTRATTVTTRSLVEAGESSVSRSDVDVPAGWEDLYATATEAEKKLLGLLAVAGVAKPELGVETQAGIPLDIAWPDRGVGVAVDLADDERVQLSEEGWTIVDAVVDDVLAALAVEGGVS